MCPLPLTLARVIPPSIVVQTSIWTGIIRSKILLLWTLKLQTLKAGFKLRAHLLLTNEGLC
jgi:hypothetical protein